MATIVSAYYPIKSKFSIQQYKTWLKNLLQLPIYLVFFTTPELVEEIKQLRGEKWMPFTVILGQPFDQLAILSKFPLEFWKKQHDIDHERHYHTPELYIIWANKISFVKQAMELEKPWKHDVYSWMDAGSWRNNDTASQVIKKYNEQKVPPAFKMINYPYNLGKIDKTKSTWVSIFQFKPEDYQVQKDGLKGNLIKRDSIGGGLFIVPNKQVCDELEATYYDALQRSVQAGRLSCKDQSIFGLMILEHPEKYNVLNGNGDWFYLQKFLLT